MTPLEKIRAAKAKGPKSTATPPADATTIEERLATIEAHVSDIIERLGMRCPPQLQPIVLPTFRPSPEELDASIDFEGARYDVAVKGKRAISGDSDCAIKKDGADFLKCRFSLHEGVHFERKPAGPNQPRPEDPISVELKRALTAALRLKA